MGDNQTNDSARPRGRMRRLNDAFYRGHAFVHWSMTLEGRKTGWLDAGLHAELRMLLLHVLHRYRLLCPVYCCMPDHLHILWMGCAEKSDQNLAVRFFRQYANALLITREARFQKQAWDVVLTEAKRERNAFESGLFYIAENPAREGLVENAGEWPFSGSMAVGYPDFDWRQPDFGERLWTIYQKEMKPCDESSLPER